MVDTVYRVRQLESYNLGYPIDGLNCKPWIETDVQVFNRMLDKIS